MRIEINSSEYLEKLQRVVKDYPDAVIIVNVEDSFKPEEQTSEEINAICVNYSQLNLRLVGASWKVCSKPYFHWTTHKSAIDYPYFYGIAFTYESFNLLKQLNLVRIFTSKTNLENL